MSTYVYIYIYVHIKCIYIYIIINIYIYIVYVPVCVCTCIPVGAVTSDYWWCTFQHARRRIASSARATLALWKLDVTSRAGVSQNPKQHCNPVGSKECHNKSNARNCRQSLLLNPKTLAGWVQSTSCCVHSNAVQWTSFYLAKLPHLAVQPSNLPLDPIFSQNCRTLQGQEITRRGRGIFRSHFVPLPVNRRT